MSSIAASVSAVLLDLDGTLVGTKALYMEAYRAAVRRHIREDLSDEDIMALRPTSELAFLRAVVAEERLEACLRDFYTAYDRLHPQLFEGIYDGVPDLLDAIRGAGLPTGIVTGKSRRSWEITSAACALGAFDVLIFDDDVRAPKPDPHGLVQALEALEVPPDEAIYVGDTVTDVQAARAAGLRPVAALWARKPEDRADYADRVRDAGATIAETPEEVRVLLGLAAAA
ncbi:MAG TPA: HAD-IA family hydrolase [Longimicrobiales bacterium]|nr:HAD-IA family hydrolase [Longimicrobiales bacterium]